MTRKPEEPSPADASPVARAPRLTVALAASAASAPALTELFSHVPRQTGFAFVVVLRAESREQRLDLGMLRELGRLSVVQAVEGARLEPDQVCVVPGDARWVLERGELCTGPAPGTHPVDTFLQSLAKDCGETAVAILLAPAGHDETDGIRCVRDLGGLTLAEAAIASREGSDARAAFDASSADFLVPIEQMAPLLLVHARSVAKASATRHELESLRQRLEASQRETRALARTSEQQRTNVALRDRASRWDKAQQVAHLGSWELVLEHGRLEWSDEVYRIFGVAPQEFDGTYGAFLRAVHPDDRAAVDAAYASSIRDGRDTYEIEHRIVRRDNGEIRVVQEKCEHLRDSSGRIVGSVGMVLDVTDRKRMEDEVREAHERIASLARFPAENPDPVLRLSREGTLLYANESALSVLRELRLAIGDVAPPELTAPAAEAIAQQRRVQRELTTGGRSVSMTFSPAGDEVNVYGQDISPRKRAEEELSAREHRLALATDAARLGVLEWDVRADQATWENDRMYEIFGRSREDGSLSRAALVAEAIHPDDVATFQQSVDESMQSGTPLHLSFRIRRKSDGQTRWIEVSGTFSRAADGSPSRLVGVLADVTDRRNARAEVERARHWFERIAHTTPDLVFVLEVVDSRFVYSNRSLVENLGYSDDDAPHLLQFLRQAVHPEDLPEVEVFYRSMADATPGEVRLVTYRVRDKDGSTRWLENRVTPFKWDETGRLQQVLGLTRDITDRVRSEEALRESEERFRVALKHSWFVPSQCDRELRYRWIYYPQGGLDPAAVLGKRDDEIEDSEGARRAVALKRRVLETGQGAREEISFLRAEGLRTWDITVEPLRDASGSVVGVTSAAFNISDRKRAEEALERSRTGLARLAEASLQVIRQTSFDDLLRVICESALKLTGARHAVSVHGLLAGQPSRSGSARVPGAPECPTGAMFVADRGGVHLDLMEGASSIRLTDAELRAHPRWWGLPDANHVPLRGLLGAALVDRNGRASGMLLCSDKDSGEFTAEDESLLRQLATVASLTLQHIEARMALEESDRRKGEFLAMLSHELRNPLAPMRNSLSILDNTDPASDQALRARAVIARQVAHMTQLVGDLLDITRVSRGKIRLRREPLDLGELVRRVVDDYRASFASAGVEVQTSIPAHPVPVLADRTRLAQVLGNLLDNAAKFTPRAGLTSVIVQEQEPSRSVSLSVRDTGAGIAPEMLDRLFEPFAQADTTLDRSRGGLGLGLALVKGLVEMHGGTVSAASDGMGKGAEFTLQLPLLDTELPGPGPTVREHATSGPWRVLIVEDNVDAADSLRELLELGGHTVEVVHSGHAALERAPGFQPELILCDIGLPGMDGFQVARAFRAQPSSDRLTLVALSGYATPEDVRKAREAGFDHHLAKPASVERLQQVVGWAPRPRDTGAQAVASRSGRASSGPIPPKAAAPRPLDSTARPAPQSSPFRVLLAEDSTANRTLGIALLKSLGVDAQGVADGSQALELLSREHFDAVLMDIEMPGMDGLEATRRIRKGGVAGCASDLPIVALTGHVAPEDRARFLDAGMNDHLPKPIDREGLQRVLSPFLARIPPKSATAGGTPPESQPARKPVSARPPRGSGRRVLVADDHPVNRMVAVGLLELLGHRVTAVSDGVEVLAALEKERFDIVFMDLSMPNLGGLETASGIRAREQGSGERLPLVSVSGSPAVADDEQYRRAGFDHHLRKPYSARDLQSTLERLTVLSSPECAIAATEERSPPSPAEQSELEKAAYAKATQALNEEYPNDLAQIDEAISRGDGPALRAAAHRLKGAIALLSTGEAYECAAMLEQIGGREDLADARTTRDRLVAAMRALLDASTTR